MIEISNLTKSYGKKPVLNDINLTFEKGTVTGIVGENGAGKTTLFRCLAGLEKFNGTVSSPFSPLKNKLGLLLTESFFFSKITGKEYIQLLCNARDVTMPDLDKQNIFNLPLNEYAANYSTGMKKKLALTAIFLQKNEVFILDEPFNGVDIQSNILITEIIHKLKSLQKTVILSSHIFSTLTETCDTIHLIQNGTITQSVEKPAFHTLEKEMKQATIGNRINELDLS